MESVRIEFFRQVVVQLERVLDDERRVGGQRRVLARLDVESVARQRLTTFSREFWSKTKTIYWMVFEQIKNKKNYE